MVRYRPGRMPLKDRVACWIQLAATRACLRVSPQNDEGGRESTGEVQVAIECHPVQSAGGSTAHWRRRCVDDSTLESAAFNLKWARAESSVRVLLLCPARRACRWSRKCRLGCLARRSCTGDDFRVEPVADRDSALFLPPK